MKLNEAIVSRIEEICNEQGSNICDISLLRDISIVADVPLFSFLCCSEIVLKGLFCDKIYRFFVKILKKCYRYARIT